MRHERTKTKIDIHTGKSKSLTERKRAGPAPESLLQCSSYHRGTRRTTALCGEFEYLHLLVWVGLVDCSIKIVDFKLERTGQKPDPATSTSYLVVAVLEASRVPVRD
jgi:hypothetical protein